MVIEDALQRVFDVARTPAPVGLVAAWAAIGVVAAVIVVRLRDGVFGRRVGAALFALGGASVVLLCVAARAEAPVYKFVDEVIGERQQLRVCRKHLQVHGRVVPGSIERRLGTDEYRFRMESREDRPRATLEVRYNGLVPDTFRSGVEVVAKGTLAGDGGLDVEPDGIMAKCPSMLRPLPAPEWQAVEPGS
jgi:cytochrome c-type biogenesis protein CcmE